MISVPSWVAGAVLSLVVILLGNFIQSAVEGWRERRRNRKEWYDETASLARQMKQVYEQRRGVHVQRHEETDDVLKSMTSGVKNEIRDELREKMDKLDAHTWAAFDVDTAVVEAIDELDRMLILAKREGVDGHIDDILDQCDELARMAEERAEEYNSWLL